MTPCPRAFLATILLLITATPAAAQAVRGQLREADRDRPIPGARLYLLDEAGGAVDSTLSDASGRFRLRAPAAGVHSLFFQIDGWASIPSEPLSLEPGATTEFLFRVPLVASDALRQMSEIIRTETRLQESLPEICGEPFRPWEAGLLIGVVRVRATSEPIAGASVTVASAHDGTARSTLSSDRGIYILCNVPAGPAVRITAAPPSGIAETIEVEIRAGSASWYDLPLGPR